MPLYAYQCETCGSNRDHYAKVAERDSHGPECCQKPMARKLTACAVQMPGGDVSYKCPMTGEVVKSMRRRQYLMEKNDVVDARDFTEEWKRKDAQRKAEKAEAKAYYDSLPKAVHDAAAASGPVT